MDEPIKPVKSLDELDKPIESLDELSKGDIVLVGDLRPQIVYAIGAFPQHELKVTLCVLYKELPGELSNYLGYLTQSDPIVENGGVRLVNDRSQYGGWKYLAPSVVSVE